MHYFNPADVIEEKTREALNMKLKIMNQEYNDQLIRYQRHNEKLNEQISKYKETQKYGDVSIQELDCYNMVRKLGVVCSDAEEIWLNIEKQFGFGFFNQMIEKEFGINPDTHSKIAK